MFQISEKDLGNIIHDLVNITEAIKYAEQGTLSDEQRKILDDCAIKLCQIRQKILEEVENGEDIK